MWHTGKPPKEDGIYIVTAKDESRVIELHLTNGKWIKEGYLGYSRYMGDVIAWIPLPKPFIGNNRKEI